MNYISIKLLKNLKELEAGSPCWKWIDDVVSGRITSDRGGSGLSFHFSLPDGNPQGALCIRVSPVLFLTICSSSAAPTWSSQFKKQGKDWRMRLWQPLTAHFFSPPLWFVLTGDRREQNQRIWLLTEGSRSWGQTVHDSGGTSLWHWPEPQPWQVLWLCLRWSWWEPGMQVGASPLESEQTWVPGVPPPSTSPVTVGK